MKKDEAKIQIKTTAKAKERFLQFCREHRTDQTKIGKAAIAKITKEEYNDEIIL